MSTTKKRKADSMSTATEMTALSSSSSASSTSSTCSSSLSDVKKDVTSDAKKRKGVSKKKDGGGDEEEEEEEEEKEEEEKDASATELLSTMGKERMAELRQFLAYAARKEPNLFALATAGAVSWDWKAAAEHQLGSGTATEFDVAVAVFSELGTDICERLVKSLSLDEQRSLLL
jgi:hypothetical protein